MADAGDLGIEGYTDAQEIARGGFSTVYRAFQPKFNRTVAIKVLNVRPDLKTAKRFEQECKAVGALSGHPNIVTVFDAGFTPSGQPFLTMLYLPEGSLADRLARDGPMEWPEALETALKLAGALESAHAAGLLHRDVKPENVLVSPHREPLLADFGLARLEGAAETKTDSITASIAHAAPEIFDKRPASVASDIYSLGSTVMCLLLGVPPFFADGDESVLSMLSRIALEAPPDLRVRGVPEAFCAVLESTMAKDPADRPRSATHLRLDLKAAALSARAVPTPHPVSAPARDPKPAPPAPLRPEPAAAPPPAPPPPPPPERAPAASPAPAPTPPPVPPPPAPTPPPSSPESVPVARARKPPVWLWAALAVLVVGVVAAVLLGGGGSDAPSDEAAPSPEETTTTLGVNSEGIVVGEDGAVVAAPDGAPLKAFPVPGFVGFQQAKFRPEFAFVSDGGWTVEPGTLDATDALYLFREGDVPGTVNFRTLAEVFRDDREPGAGGEGAGGEARLEAPDDLADFLRGYQQLTINSSEQATCTGDGLACTRLDVTASGDTKSCSTPCVLVAPAQNEENNFVLFGVNRNVIFVFDVGDQPVLVSVESAPETFDAFLPIAMDLLNSVRFAGDCPLRWGCPGEGG